MLLQSQHVYNNNKNIWKNKQIINDRDVSVQQPFLIFDKHQYLVDNSKRKTIETKNYRTSYKPTCNNFIFWDSEPVKIRVR
jgi:hypothetical protein